MARTTSRLGTWVSRDHWAERIVTFNASWFLASMSTGIIVQILTNFPYPAQWLRSLAYCFWILTIVLFFFFTLLGTIRCVCYPRLTQAIFQDFYQTSFLGAIPVTIDVIISGIVIFYSVHPAAVWMAFGLFWIPVVGSLVVGGIVVFIACARQEAPELSSVNGVWFVSFIPFIVTASTGVTLVPHLPIHLQGYTIVVAFLLWSIGMIMVMFISVIYFWRLMRHKLPVRDAIVSCFIPVGPAGLGAYDIHSLAIATSSYIRARKFSLVLETSNSSLQSSDQVGTAIHWVGVMASLFLLALATFWLLQGTLSVLYRVPKRFNVGFWSFVFPNGVYTNAVALLAKDLNNHGLRGWAATMGVVTVLLWCFCTWGTVWKGVWRGELFFPPGLEGWNDRKTLGMENEGNGSKDSQQKLTSGTTAKQNTGNSLDLQPRTSETSSNKSYAGDAEMIGQDVLVITQRTSRADGTYTLSKWRKKKQGNRSRSSSV